MSDRNEPGPDHNMWLGVLWDFSLFMIGITKTKTPLVAKLNATKAH